MNLSCSDKLMIVVCAAPLILAAVKDVEGESDLFSVGGTTVDMCCVELIHRAFAHTQRSTGQRHTQAALQYAYQPCIGVAQGVSQCMCFQVSTRVGEAQSLL